MTAPYIEKNAGDLILAEDWNQMQVSIRDEVGGLSSTCQDLTTRLISSEQQLGTLRSDLGAATASYRDLSARQESTTASLQKLSQDQANAGTRLSTLETAQKGLAQTVDGLQKAAGKGGALVPHTHANDASGGQLKDGCVSPDTVLGLKRLTASEKLLTASLEPAGAAGTSLLLKAPNARVRVEDAPLELETLSNKSPSSKTPRQALAHISGDKLSLNEGSGFTGGIRVNGLTEVANRLTVGEQISVGAAATDPAPGAEIKLHLQTPANTVMRCSTAGFNTSFGQVQGSWNGLDNPGIIQPIGTAHDLSISPATNSPALGMVLKASGNVGMGTASPQTRLHVLSPAGGGLRLQATGPNNAGWGACRVEFWSDAQGSGTEWRPGFISSGDRQMGTFTGRLEFYTNGTGSGARAGSVMAMYLENGGIFTGKGVAITSDQRLKTDIQPLSSSLERLLQVRGVHYRLKTESADGARHLGVLAQQVEAAFPDAVVTGADGLKSVRYDALIAPLIEAVRELKAEVDTLKQGRSH